MLKHGFGLRWMGCWLGSFILGFTASIAHAGGQGISEGKRLLALPEGIEASQPRWSPDGQHVAYRVSRDGQWVAVYDGEEIGTFDFLGPPMFSPSGQHYAWSAGNKLQKRGDSWKAERWWMIIDGELLGRNDWLGGPTFFGDGERLLYWSNPKVKLDKNGAYTQKPHFLNTATKKGSRWTIKTHKEKWGTSTFAPELSGDGNWIAYPTFDSGKGKHYLFVSNGKKNLSIPKGGLPGYPNAVAFLDKKNWAVSFSRYEQDSAGNFQQRERILFQEEEYGSSYDDVGHPALSDDGKHLAYLFEQEEKVGVVLDEEERVKASWDHAFFLEFAPDGERFAVVASRGGKYKPYGPATNDSPFSEVTRPLKHRSERVLGAQEGVEIHWVRKGKEVERSESYEKIQSLHWDPNGERLAFVAQEEDKVRLVVDEHKSELFDHIGEPRFSSDGKRVGFGAVDGQELWWKILVLE